MFVYLSKKIAIPNNTVLHCISWNKNQGYIACGGDDGLLKVLKLDSDGNVTNASRGSGAPSNLSMNQTLEGHSNAVRVVTWNESVQQKLTSSDGYGLIIVWMLYKGSWYEEMINNRNKSVVRDMKWNADGQKICIVYEDGAVIVGSVDGNRIWGRELKSLVLTNVEWSPDGHLLLFGVQNGDVHVFDNAGNDVNQISIKCLTHVNDSMTIAGIEWYNGKGGYVEADCPRLAICFSNGRMQIMKNESDREPVLVDAGDIQAVGIRWNHDGSILALAGIAKFSEGNLTKECNVIQFYSSHGIHLRTLKVPGRHISGCSWDGTGLRMALAIDHFIYFANIRPDYKWCYFSNTVVYSYVKPERSDVCLVFWDTKNNECCVKYVKHLVAIASGPEYCVLSTKSEENNDEQFALVICNAIGTPVESKYVTIMPTFVSMSSNYILAASPSYVLLWRYSTPQAKSALGLGNSIVHDDLEKVFHIDEISQSSNNNNNGSRNLKEKSTSDPISCICHSTKVALVARESGVIYQYQLPAMAWMASYNLLCQPHVISLNCTSNRACVIDSSGVVFLVELSANKKELLSDKEALIQRLDRKDVWDMMWCMENSELFVLMEKTRMYVFRNTEPEEPTTCSGYICSFEGLQVKTVLLDAVLKNPTNPSPQMVVNMEVKSLRDTRELLEKVGISEAKVFVEDNSHPRLWRLLAEAALEQMDLNVAETALVRCKDLAGIKFVKSLHNIQNEKLRKAEVAAYFQKFDEAEKLYLENDRRDLAINLRRKLGDWFRVVQLIKSVSTAGNDALLEEAWNAIGDYFADRQKWESAVKYYEESSNHERLAVCYYALEDYAKLEQLANLLPDGHKLLFEMAGMFSTLGMCDQAVSIYIKNNNVKAAVDCCVTLNNWSKAVELAERHKLNDIAPLLAKYSQYLFEKKEMFNAVELYRKAGGFLDATQLLCKIAKDESLKKAPPLHLKKIYALAGLLIEEHRHTQHARNSNKQKASISSLLEEETLVASMSHNKLLDNAWQGAEAYHFYLLAQRQLYSGLFDQAMTTALHLQDYENILDPEEIYILIALTSCANRSFGVCSKAFIKLESLEEISSETLELYENLAMDIFVKFSPRNMSSYQVECPTCNGKMDHWSSSTCLSCNSKYPVCMASGRPLLEASERWSCHRCKRCASLQEMMSRKTCPLCHASV